MFAGYREGFRSGKKKEKGESRGQGENGSRAPVEALGRGESSFSFGERAGQ